MENFRDNTSVLSSVYYVRRRLPRGFIPPLPPYVVQLLNPQADEDSDDSDEDEDEEQANKSVQDNDEEKEDR